MGKKKKQRPIKTRDHLMVKVINGATKSGVHLDHKKENDKYAAREDMDEDLFYIEEICLWCFEHVKNNDESVDELFCSQECCDKYHDSEGL